jgi:deoxyribodipyrimidine photo-lyase
VTGINIPRIYNPVKQGQDQDPTGAFTRRWLPELAGVPDAYLHAPWRWTGAGQVLGRRYPEPLVDPEMAARAAREAIADLRRAADYRAEAKAIALRHASRADARFVNDRAPRPSASRPARPRSPTTQLQLDL